MTHSLKPKGVGGWLLFFVVTLVLSVLRTLGGFYVEKEKAIALLPEIWQNEVWLQYMSLMTALVWISAALFSLAIYWLTASRQRKVVSWVIVAIWAAGPGITILSTALTLLMIPGASFDNGEGTILIA